MTSHGTELRYRSAELTDVGKKPEYNEDTVLSLPDYGIFCVADGMGSIPDEEIASQTAVKMLVDKMSFAHAESMVTLTSRKRSTSPLHAGVINSPQASTLESNEVTILIRRESTVGSGLSIVKSIVVVWARLSR